MSPYHELAEARIRDAFEAGEFEKLEGTGRPLDLDGYFATPEGWRMGLSILRSAGVVPEEVELLKELGRWKERLGQVTTGAERELAQRKVAELSATYEEKMQRYRRAR